MRRGHHDDMGAACGVVEACRAVRRHGIGRITSGKVAVYGGVIRCAAGFSTHTSVSMAPTPHDISDSPGVDVCSTLFDDACKGEAEWPTRSRTRCS